MRQAVKKEKRKKLKKQYVVLIIIFIICLLIIGYKLFEKYLQTKSNNELKDILNEVVDVENNDTEEIKESKIDKLEELQKENSDIVALIEIDGTNINYPVLQGKDNSFYMTHNYKKEESKDGSLFLDKDYNWDLPSTNLLIYGHNNIGSSEMFVELNKFKDENFYKEHKKVKFTTNEEEAEYEIISVFLTRVFYKNETNVFRYYYFINANNEKEFDDYVQNAKKASIYNIDATAKYGDQLLTLSTCSYHVENGRLAVVARKIEKDEKL